MRYPFVLILLLAAIGEIHSQPVVAFESLVRNVNGRELTLDLGALTAHSGERISVSGFPVSANESSLVILAPRRTPISATTTLIAGDQTLRASRGMCWSGCLRSDRHSRVFVSIFNGYLFASIERPGSAPFVICPDKNLHDTTRYVCISQSDLLSTSSVGELKCLNEDLPELGRNRLQIASQNLPPRAQSYHALLQTDIAVEVDSCFYQAAGGNMELTEAYINALFAMSSAIYEDEAQITFRIPWLKVWTSGDPYNVKGNAYALPDTVRSYWHAHYADVKRDLAHVMTSIGYGGGGFGWFAICNTDYGYSVSSPITHQNLPTFAFTYDAYIVSHEIGHNFGLPHSHSCYWNPPLDTCYTKDDASLKLDDACYGLPVTPRKNPGTLMSYCANANYQLSGRDIREYKLGMTFSKRVADTLRRNAEMYTCITEPPDATVRLLNPRGGIAMSGDSTISIEWTSAHVASVSLRYRSDMSSAWTSIADNISATDGQVNWKLPNVSTTTAMIEVHDASDPSIADTSLLPIEIAQHAAVPETVSEQAPYFSERSIDFGSSYVGSTYTICNVLGESVMSGSIGAEGRLSIRELDGVYILRVTRRDQVRSYRFAR